MAGMQALRKQAKAAGVPSSEIRSAESSAELRSLIKSAGKNGSGKGRVVKKASAVKKGSAKRGRPKGSKNKATASKSKATTRKASGRKATTRKNSNSDGRHTLDGVNFSDTDGWNPRDGSVPDVIVKALRKARGNRSKVFTALKGKLDKLVPRKTRDGRSRTKSEREDYLRYLISRNAWAFAIATGQHESSENRVEYGTGGTGEGKFKRGKTRKAAPKRSTGTAKRGRPKGSKNARKATGAKRGRPKGSKNKAKAAGRKAAKKR